MQIIVRDGILVTPDGRARADVLIREGRIAEIGDLADRPGRTIDAHGCVVLPGAVDPHVHFNRAAQSGGGFVDDFASGTRAAINGGVTTVGQMSFSEEASLWPALLADAEHARAQSAIDFVLHPGAYAVSDLALEEIPQLAASGYATLKLVSLVLDEDPRNFLSAMARAAECGSLVLMHCEDGAMIDFATARLTPGARHDMAHYPATRPVVSESAAVERAIAMAELTGAGLYLVHLSSRAALESARHAKARGQAVHIETRPFYLHLDDSGYAGPEPGRYVGMPPLRSPDDVTALWDALADGTIDTVATDHAPWMLADKLDPSLDVVTVPKGVAELDTFLPLLYSEGVARGRISLERLAAVTSTNAARLLGLYPAKGAIAVHSDADLVVLDPDETRVVRASDLHSRSDYSVYEGRRVTGWPRFVLSRGEVVLSPEGMHATPGRGKHLTPAPRQRPQ